MELGTGILLSAVFLGTVALFIATKDRWNWKKIFLWPLGVIVGLGVVGGSIAYLYQQYEDRPRKIHRAMGCVS
jgi:membrane protein YdbS with pleckstrin-like domain